MNVTIVGTGYVGLVTGTCFAEMGHHVLCIDNDTQKIDQLKALHMPIHEEGLPEMVERNVKEGRLSFSTSIEEGTQFAEIIFIAVGTPPGYRGQANLSYVEQVGRQVAENMTDYRLLVEKSTVPVNTATQLKRAISRYLNNDMEFDVASNPEFLKEGAAVKDAFNPDRIIVGVESERAAGLLRELYKPLIDKTGCPFVEMSLASAELTKHASNSFLALKISFINAVSRVCELCGADIEQVAYGMGLDKRIGPQFLNAGVGYGGSCFPKDVDAFVFIAEELGYSFELLKEVQRINKAQKEHLMQKVTKELWVIQDKNVAILGLAFKPGTDDIRESPALYFVPQLEEAGANLRLWDPVAEERFKEIKPDLAYFDDPMECMADADLAIILTDWAELREIDLDALKKSMRCPVIVDGRNLFDPQEMQAKGFIYSSIGRGG